MREGRSEQISLSIQWQVEGSLIESELEVISIEIQIRRARYSSIISLSKKKKIKSKNTFKYGKDFVYIATLYLNIYVLR